jgi:hypothetical protein
MGEESFSSFPDYDVKFFLTEPKRGSEESRFANSHYQESIQALSELHASLSRRSRFSVPDSHRLAPIARPDLVQPQVNHAHFRNSDLVVALEEATNEYFTAAAKIVFDIAKTMRQRKQAGVSVHCAVRQLGEYFVNGYAERICGDRVLRRILSLKSFVERYRESPRCPALPLEHLAWSVRESSEKVLEQIEYSAFSPFDSFLAFFVDSSAEFNIVKFDEIAALVLANATPKRIDLSPVSKLIGLFVQLLKPKNVNEATVIKSAVYRLFFDRLYLKNQAWIDGESDHRRFNSHCNRIRWLTPRQMQIPEKLMKPDMMDLSFASLVQRSAHLQNAIALLTSIQFMIDPIEIMTTIFLALKSGEEFVKQNTFENRFGQWVSMFDRDKVVKGSGNLAFDDFFPMFCLIFSLSPPVNSVAIAELLSKLSGAVLSPALDFAKLFFTSTVQYVDSVKLAKLASAEDDEDEDPLGLVHVRVHSAGKIPVGT